MRLKPRAILVHTEQPLQNVPRGTFLVTSQAPRESVGAGGCASSEQYALRCRLGLRLRQTSEGVQDSVNHPIRGQDAGADGRDDSEGKYGGYYPCVQGSAHLFGRGFWMPRLLLRLSATRSYGSQPALFLLHSDSTRVDASLCLQIRYGVELRKITFQHFCGVVHITEGHRSNGQNGNHQNLGARGTPAQP
jgi:hypothetical protein